MLFPQEASEALWSFSIDIYGTIIWISLFSQCAEGENIDYRIFWKSPTVYKTNKKAYCGHGRISKKIVFMTLLYLPVWQFFFWIKCLFIIWSRFLLTEFNKTGKSIFLDLFLTALIDVKIFLMSFLGQSNIVVNHKHVQNLPWTVRLEGQP